MTMEKLLLIPVRLALGLPPIYGLTISCRVLQLLRKAGLYRGSIDFVCVAKPIHFGVEGKALG